MKHYPPSASSKAALAPPRIPQFYAVHTRIRGDGWTPRRQAEFIGHLAQTRSVTEAARRVGMARETAYRLRRRKWSESFCAAWDAAMGDAGSGKPPHEGPGGKSHQPDPPKRMVTNQELAWRVRTGMWQLRFYRGAFRLAWRKPDKSALFSLLARLDRAKPRPQIRAASAPHDSPRVTTHECQQGGAHRPA